MPKVYSMYDTEEAKSIAGFLKYSKNIPKDAIIMAVVIEEETEDANGSFKALSLAEKYEGGFSETVRRGHIYYFVYGFEAQLYIWMRSAYNKFKIRARKAIKN